MFFIFIFYISNSITKNLLLKNNQLLNNDNNPQNIAINPKNIQQSENWVLKNNEYSKKNKKHFLRKKRQVFSDVFIETEDLENPLELLPNDPLKRIDSRNEILSLSDPIGDDISLCHKFLYQVNLNLSNITNLQCDKFVHPNESTIKEIKRLQKLLKIKVEIAFLIDSIHQKNSLYQLAHIESLKNDSYSFARLVVLQNLNVEKEKLLNLIKETKEEFIELYNKQIVNKN